MARSIQLMGDTGTNFNVTSDSVRADSFYGFTDGLHTVAIYMNNFTGRLFIEGTLATVPTDNDWFSINIGNNVVDYMDATAHTGVIAKTFQGNFVYLRGRVDRSYLSVTDNTNLAQGRILKVLLNH